MLIERDLYHLRPYLLRTAYNWTFTNKAINKIGIEDLVQNTLIYLWDERRYYDSKTPIKKYARYMMRAELNTMIDLYRLRNGQ